MHDHRDKHEEQDQSGSGLGWFLTGAAIGAAVAILYAPKSGKDTRGYIAEKTNQGKEAVGSASDNIVEASREMFERGRKLVEDASDLFERGKKLVRG
jgi:gas vesicle protein